jgi:hypothetical protein
MTLKNRKKTVINPMLPTPMWAKNVFRVALYLVAGFEIYIYKNDMFSASFKEQFHLVEIAFVLPGIHLFTKIFGIKEKE